MTARGTRRRDADVDRPRPPVVDRLWFRLVLVACFFVPAVSASPYDPAETPAVVQAVLQDPLIVTIPALLPIAKVLLAVVAALPFIGIRWAGSGVLAYYAGVLVVVAFLQNMSVTNDFGAVWLVGNTATQLVVAVACIVDVSQGRTRLDRASLRPRRLWLLLPMALALLMPYAVVDGHPAPSAASILWNESGLTYCMITPVVLGLFLIFPDGVDRRTLSVASFVGVIFAVINIVVWFLASPLDWWMGVLHIPLMITATFGLIDVRRARHLVHAGRDAPETPPAEPGYRGGGRP